MLLAAVQLILLTGPDNQRIELNPQQVVTLREPRTPGDQEHFPKAVRCLIHTTDGKFVTVTETCDQVRQLLQQNGISK